MSEAKLARDRAYDCVVYAEYLRNLHLHGSWLEMRTKAEDFFPSLAEAQMRMSPFFDRYRKLGAPMLHGLTGSAHEQAYRLLSKLVVAIDKGGATRAIGLDFFGNPLYEHDRNKPVEVNLPVGLDVLREWIEKEYQTTLEAPCQP
jgi:hypothetical protein